MNPRPILCRLLSLLLLTPPLAWAQAGALPDYRTGDRLLQAPSAERGTFREIQWDDLIPKTWDPLAAFKGLDLARMKDSDPKAIEALERLKKEWAQAPVSPALAGQKVRLPGFAVPLEKKGRDTVEFLLVPYFGACIHTPPPPANQVIQVIPDKPVTGLATMDAVWVSGTLTVHRAETGMGVAGYRLHSVSVTPYVKPAAEYDSRAKGR